MDVNHNQVTMAAIDAQDAGRELSRLEASIIGQYLSGIEGDFWHDIYYRPRSAFARMSDVLHQNYSDARWDERIAWDMLGTYCLNTPDM